MKLLKSAVLAVSATLALSASVSAIAGQAAALSDADIANVAAYFSSLK